MEIAYPKKRMVVKDIVNEIQQKAHSSLKVIRTIEDQNGLFGLHNCILNRAFKGANDLIFWINDLLVAENCLKAAFQFWENLKVQIRVDELMYNFLFELKNYNIEPEPTADVTSMVAISIIKAICNVQQTILNCPRSIKDKEHFLFTLKTMGKEDRDSVLMTELKKLQWE